MAWAQGHWLNFTHFLPPLDRQATAASPASDLLYMQAYTRQATIMRIINQPGWDILIPAYRSEDCGLNTIIDPDAFDGMAFQIKYRKAHRPLEKDWKNDFNDGVKARSSDHDLNIFVSLTAAVPDFQSLEKAEDGPLAIFVGGHSAEQYPCLSRL
jgi:hypothetical protein